MVKWKSFLALLSVVFLLVLLVGSVMLTGRPSAAAFVITGDTEGLLTPCGCRVVPAGGLARRQALLDNVRKMAKGELVIPVELANGFSTRATAKDLLNKEAGGFFSRNGYWVGVGGYDLELGLDKIRALAGKSRLFLAGRNDLDGGESIRLGGWGIGGIGDKGALLRAIFISETQPGGVSMPDPIKALGDEIHKHPAGGYVVFGSLSPETLTVIHKDFPNLIAIVATWQADVTTMPQRVGNTWVVYNGDKGRRYTNLEVSWNGRQFEAWPEGAYLGPEVPTDKAVQAGVDKVLSEARALDQKALEKLGGTVKSARPYVGDATCAKCHAEAHKIWSLSRHAKAYEDLKIDHGELDPACVSCHVTGLGSDGLPASEKLPFIQGVGCEACHGPGGGHPSAKMEKGEVSAESCGRCHTKRDSPLFNAEGYWKLINHK